MVKMEPNGVLFFATPEDLRATGSTPTSDALWIGYYKKASGRRSVSWTDVVDESLCVRWIDGVVRRIDEISHVQRLTPRRKGSNWSAINVAKVAELTTQGRMRPAGLAAFAARSDAKTAIYSYEQDPSDFTTDETERFRADEAAWTDWEGREPSYRKTVTRWVTTAKQAATRERRLVTLMEDSRAGRAIKSMAWARKET